MTTTVQEVQPHTPRLLPAPTPLDSELAQRMDRLIPPGMKPPNLFLTVARHRTLFKHLVDSGQLGKTGLMDLGTLERPLREAVILRTCVMTANAYEFNLHTTTISLRMGLTPEQIVDIREPAPSKALWSERQLAAMQLVDALVLRLEVSDELYSVCRQHLDEPALLEVTQLTGLYVGVAMLVALVRPAMDDYAPTATASSPSRSA